MTAESLVKLLQMTGAALAIPAAAAGTFAAYQSYFSSDVTCQKLRTNIVAILERHVAPETKRSLLKKDVAEFDKLCGEGDPDARAIFQAAVTEHPGDAAHAPAAAGPRMQTRPPSASRPPRSAFLVLRAPRSITAGSRSVAGSPVLGCRISTATRSPTPHCRRLAPFCPRK
jgi:hypothetical protein